jgi:hypothetical protein
LTGNFIDEWLANLIGLTYDLPLLEHAYQTPATLKRRKRSFRLVLPTEQESLFCAVRVGGRWGVDLRKQGGVLWVLVKRTIVSCKF